MKKYDSLDTLLAYDKQAKEYFHSLPDYVQQAVQSRAQGINSFESMCHYADNLTRGDH